MKRHALTLAALLAGIASSSPAVDLADDYGRLIGEGIEAAREGNFDDAVVRFGDAHLTKPEGREAPMNLAISLARGGNAAEAAERFGRIAEKARADNPALAAQAMYNRGRALYDVANAAFGESDTKTALENAIEAFSSFGEALELDETLAEARFNREQTRRLIEKIAEMQPQSSQDGDDGSDQPQDSPDEDREDGGNEQEQSDDPGQDEQNPGEDGQGDGESSQNPGESESDQGGENEPGEEDSDSEQNPDEGEQEEEPDQSGESDEANREEPTEGESTGSGEGTEEGSPMETGGMTPEQARNLLRHLDGERLLPLRLKSPPREVEKKW